MELIEVKVQIYMTNWKERPTKVGGKPIQKILKPSGRGSVCRLLKY